MSQALSVNWAPHGSIIGPILYSLYLLPLSHIIKQHDTSFHCYADDTQLYLSFKPSAPAELSPLHNCPAEVKDWMAVNFHWNRNPYHSLSTLMAILCLLLRYILLKTLFQTRTSLFILMVIGVTYCSCVFSFWEISVELDPFFFFELSSKYQSCFYHFSSGLL